MSKINDLIKEMCPNGVNFYKIKEISSVTIGEFVHKNKQSDDGQYPVYNGGTSNTGFYDEYNNDGHKVIISARGANAGFINRVKGKYWAGNSCYTININDESKLDWNYLYQYLKNNQSTLLGVQQTGSIPAISKKQVEEFKIAIPPLEVQEEIVRILDKFGGLEAELEAELEARKSQYEFWREKMCNKFDDNCVLGNSISVLRGKRLTKKDLCLDGKYNVYHGGLDPLGKFNDYNREEDTVMIINVGASAGTVGYSKEKFWSSDGCYCLSKSSDYSSKYLYYYLKNKEKEFVGKVRKAGIPTLDAKVIESIKLPVISLDGQERITKILDKFEKLINDESIGIPAEIELRRKQYEYYRNKLLSFEELSVSE